MRVVLFGLFVTMVLMVPLAADAGEIDSLVAAIKDVGPMGEGNRSATSAWKELARTDARRLPELLRGLEDASPLAANWLRAAIDTIA